MQSISTRYKFVSILFLTLLFLPSHSYAESVFANSDATVEGVGELSPEPASAPEPAPSDTTSE